MPQTASKPRYHGVMIDHRDSTEPEPDLLAKDPFYSYVAPTLRLFDAVLNQAAQGMSIEESVESSFEDLEEEFFSLARHTWARRAELEHDYRGEAEARFAALDVAIGIHHSLGQILQSGAVADSSLPPHSVRYACLFLHSRSLKVAHEICALLRAGLASGALGRWRTLHELEVVSRTLLLGNRGTSSRFINHKWIIICRDPEAFIPGGDGYEQRLKEAQRHRRLYLRRYGPEFEGEYGWASELTRRRLGVTKPKMADLRRLTNLGGHYSNVRVSNHLIHPDSVSALFDVDLEEDSFHGGVVFGGDELEFSRSILTLTNITNILVRLWCTNNPWSPKALALSQIAEEGGVTLASAALYDQVN